MNADRFPYRFPLVPGKKIPAVKDWKTWTGPIPDGAPFGIPTGPGNGFWALDLDLKDGKDGFTSLSEYMSEHGGAELPDTYAVRTPTGGAHLYFKWDDARPVRNHKGLLGKESGVDIRGAGGLVAFGEGYTVSLDVPIIEAPAWLYELVASKAKEPDAPAVSAIAIGPEHPEFSWRVQEAAQYLANAAPESIQGQDGNTAWLKVANELVRGFELPIATSLELLASWNATKATPPWTEPEMVRDLGRMAAGEITGFTKPSGWRSRGAASFMAGAAPRPRNVLAGVARVRLRILSAIPRRGRCVRPRRGRCVRQTARRGA
jgi:hypothetical protein